MLRTFILSVTDIYKLSYVFYSSFIGLLYRDPGPILVRKYVNLDIWQFENLFYLQVCE
jgi:hypothetical protein